VYHAASHDLLAPRAVSTTTVILVKRF